MHDPSLRLPSSSAAHPVGPPSTVQRSRTAAPRRLSSREVQPIWVLAALSTLGIVAVSLLDVLIVVLNVRWYDALAELSSGALYVAEREMEVPSLAGDRVTAIESAAAALGQLSRLAYFGAGVAFVAWHYRARVNLEGLGITGFKRSQGWVLGAWLLPIVSLVMPYGMVAEVHRASDPAFPRQRPAREGDRADRLLVSWWTAWVAMSIVSLVYSGLYWWLFKGDLSTADLLDTRATVLLVDGLTAALTVIAGVLAVLVLIRITRRQHALTKLATVPGPGIAADPAVGTPA